MLSACLMFLLSTFLFFMVNWGVEILFYSSIMALIGSMYLLMALYSDDFLYSSFGGFMDGLSMNLILLSFWITLLMLISSYKIFRFDEFKLVFINLIFMLNFVLMITFMVGNYLMFYFFFEISLIPTLLIIMGWGYQPERLQAGVYFIFYTITASLPLLFGVLFFYNSFMSVNFLMVSNFLGVEKFYYVSFIFIMAFLVKLPMFLVHLWLPKAHVEAPVAGSMILAGVLLKLGGYGLMRFGLLVYQIIMKFNLFIFGLSLFGMIYVGLICCRLNDLKALVAYSSVSHMAMVICGSLTSYLWGFEGALVMMVSHGLSSSGLFCIVNMYYERLGSRSFFLNKGLIMIMPIFSLLLFMLVAANIAAPPSINLFSEIFLMGSIMSFDISMVLVFPIGSFLGAVFSVFLYSFSQHGKNYFLSYGFLGVSFREIHTLILHLAPVNFLILNPYVFLSI